MTKDDIEIYDGWIRVFGLTVALYNKFDETICFDYSLKFICEDEDVINTIEVFDITKYVKEYSQDDLIIQNLIERLEPFENNLKRFKYQRGIF